LVWRVQEEGEEDKTAQRGAADRGEKEQKKAAFVIGRPRRVN